MPFQSEVAECMGHGIFTTFLHWSYLSCRIFSTGCVISSGSSLSSTTSGCSPFLPFATRTIPILRSLPWGEALKFALFMVFMTSAILSSHSSAITEDHWHPLF